MIEKDHALWSDKDIRNNFKTSRPPCGRELRYGERRYTCPDQSEIAKVKRGVTAIPKDALDADLEAKTNKMRVANGRTINMKDPCGYEVVSGASAGLREDLTETPLILGIVQIIPPPLCTQFGQLFHFLNSAKINLGNFFSFVFAPKITCHSGFLVRSAFILTRSGVQ